MRQLFMDEFNTVVAYDVSARFSIDGEHFVALVEAQDPKAFPTILKLDQDDYGQRTLSFLESDELHRAYLAYLKHRDEFLN
ncbi:hypothetical protein O6R05_01960 [Peptoniphilus equinus]|uniref:DUF1292 domain-containing protein n=1 Tax=Peptoniphilus equinus TaxID=3016343 RepID=A0ABY7QU75_9FIRM|nr:hypothetical protein [Peptoniphilus equinus]WBW50330.1 hypothetical protein O6R05_01960 [Peptoniphilus equinus]